jgi:hypothetical protein
MYIYNRTNARPICGPADISGGGGLFWVADAGEGNNREGRAKGKHSEKSYTSHMV